MSDRTDRPNQAEYGLLTAYLARLGYTPAERKAITNDSKPGGRNWHRIAIDVSRRIAGRIDAPGVD